MQKRILIAIATVVIAVLGVLGIIYTRHGLDVKPSSLVKTDILDRLPKVSRSSADLSRIGSNVTFPPTNSWISGMVLQKEPKPVYPMPHSFKAMNTGFEMNLPQISSTPTEIIGSHDPSLVAALGATNFTLTYFDGIVATLQYSSSTSPIADVTITSGSPYVFYTPLTDDTIILPGAINILERTARYLRFEKNGNQYAILATGGSNVQKDGEAVSITTKKGNLVTFYTLPAGSKDALKDSASNSILSGRVTFSENESSTFTNIAYETKDNKPTYFGAMGYHTVKDRQKVMGYDSVYGQMAVYEGTTFSLIAPKVEQSDSLDLSSLSAGHKQSLIGTLKKDIKASKFDAKDSYFAGKQLARAANLLDIAHQLDQPVLANELQRMLTGAFADKLNNDYFYYDSRLKGIAATTAAFGSEDFNDHHFHYGYFIYAASILGRYDTDFLTNNKDFIDLLAADIANYSPDDTTFPLRRNFDPYASHSWAAGLAPFADGNNQESSSEAIQAWNAVALWGEVTGNSQLLSSGRWLLSQESATAKNAWRSIDISNESHRNFTSPLASLGFSGKRTYATFFSDEPSAKLAIQLLPLNPAMLAFKQDGDNISKQTDAAIAADNFNVALGDYILMYSALNEPQKAAKLAMTQEDKYIDDGNSRTYMNAWIYYQIDNR